MASMASHLFQVNLRNLLKTVCFDCEMILFWQNLRKAVCFGSQWQIFCLF